MTEGIIQRQIRILGQRKILKFLPKIRFLKAKFCKDDYTKTNSDFRAKKNQHSPISLKIKFRGRERQRGSRGIIVEDNYTKNL